MYATTRIEIDTDAEGGFDNNGCSDHESEYFSDLNPEEVLNDIDDESVDDGENIYAPLIKSSRGIVIRNELEATCRVYIPMRRMHSNSMSTSI